MKTELNPKTKIGCTDGNNANEGKADSDSIESCERVHLGPPTSCGASFPSFATVHSTSAFGLNGGNLRREIPPDIHPSYEAYGCRVNALSPEELFRRYEQAGFLYPAKLEKLAPYLPLVRDNWRKAMRGGELILYCVTHEPGAEGDWATVAAWRSTHSGWQSQHLVSMGSPLCSRAAMLATKATIIHDGWARSYQNWFRPENRFPARVFGSLVESIGPEQSAVATLNLLALPKTFRFAGHPECVYPDRRNGKDSGLYALAEQARSRAFAEAEELGSDDLWLEGVDQLYARVGLRRYRRVWLAMLPRQAAPVGAVLAYRGPLGFNFSFLENRCDLLLSPGLTEEEVRPVALSLLAAAASAYQDFEADSFPVISDERAVGCLQEAGARFIRRYCQSVWLRDGFVGWYRHVEKFYERIVRAGRRHGLGYRAAATATAGNGHG